MEMVAWPVLGLTTVVAAAMARRRPRAVLVGRWALGALFVLAGAVVNAVHLATGTDYGDFADASMIPFVRDTWTSLVAPRQGLFIGLLIAFEAIVGLLVVTGGRRTQAALVAIMGFHVGLMAFGWFFWAWSLPMLVACALLLRAERAPGSTPAEEVARADVSGRSLTTIGR